MERKLFGTDGVRGVANEYPMTAEVALKLGRAIAHIANRGPHRHRMVVGKDTRLSGYMLEFALASGVCSFGVDVLLVGPMPTPAVAFLAKSLRADAGVMISASHNPFQDNGIKFFGADGFKLADAIEADIEELLATGALEDIRPTALDIGKMFKMEDARGRYVQFVKSAFSPDLSLDGLRLVVDCAHGATYRVAPQMLEELGAEVLPMGVRPDGKNINAGCGATAPQALQRMVVEAQADAGIALDGDGDRLILVDEQGEIVDGDAVMAIVGRELASRDALPGRKVVTTVMSNLGLERALDRDGIGLERTQVGDRYVVEAMRKSGYTFGGEQSGHLIFLDYASTGDGCVAALKILEIMVRYQKSLSELRRVYEPVPQHLVNVKVSAKPPLSELGRVSALIGEVERELGQEGRVLVRYSGTENKARVMVEDGNGDRARDRAQAIADALEAEIAERSTG
jgi:phosphoglucosamine mutase